MWPALTIVLLGALIATHLLWRAKLLRQQLQTARELQEMRLESQRSALHNQLQQETMFNSMADGIVLLDQRGKVQLANPAFARLFTLAGDVRGKALLELVRLPELPLLLDRTGARASARRESNGGEPEELALELRLPGLEERWLEINAAPIARPGARAEGTILLFHDQTRLKKLERTRQEFVANVSHELRTPLSLIKGCAETLINGAKDDPEAAAKFLRTIDRNAERLRLLVEDLLTLSEMESGRLKLNLQSVSARIAADKVIADLAYRAAARQTTLLNQVSDLALRADPDRLEQVIGNLLDNAIKYGHSKGKVIIGSRPAEAGQAEVFVQDDGPGIPSEALQRVFERFYRVDKARSREQGGTGLGLAIVKHIVHSHGGRVWAKSDPGHGATFSFTLPLDAEKS